jgi:6-pyruvoyltetrahydropterin/6-carboxytetrahydropterin synthase
MNKLTRQVRFSINPFLDDQPMGANSFCSKPAGEGLAIFLQLGVGLVGAVDPDTGFVINVVDIDKAVRLYVVPVFAETIKQAYKNGEHIGYPKIAKLLKLANNALAGKLKTGYLIELSLMLNPYRKVAVDCEDMKMIYVSEKFEFAAMHKLWNEEFSPEKNFQVFGKCANPTGHGHNYVVEVTVKMPEETEFCTGDFEKVVDEELIKLIDHKNLNADVPYFKEAIPTVENISIFAWNQLENKFPNIKMHSVTIWETDKTSCTYYG